MKNKKNKLFALLSIILLSVILFTKLHACTRALYASPDNQYVVTGRNMDWFEPMHPSLWVFPRGIARDGGVGANSVKWHSKYGSVITAAFGSAVADGLNEKGLAVNCLYLAESDFGKRDVTRPGVSWAGYVQYLLDNFATVNEAVHTMENSNIQVSGPEIPGKTLKPATLHFALSDSAGDSAIFEYLHGKLVVHHGKQFKVLTNSPIYSAQLKLNTYWESVGGEHMLPGTTRASDRYVRASYYINHVPFPKDEISAVSEVVSVMNNVAQPDTNVVDPNIPNISATLWKSFADNKNNVYYFHLSDAASAIWLAFTDFNFEKGSDVLMVKGEDLSRLSGNIKKALKKAQPFLFQFSA